MTAEKPHSILSILFPWSIVGGGLIIAFAIGLGWGTTSGRIHAVEEMHRADSLHMVENRKLAEIVADIKSKQDVVMSILARVEGNQNSFQKSSADKLDNLLKELRPVSDE